MPDKVSNNQMIKVESDGEAGGSEEKFLTVQEQQRTQRELKVEGRGLEADGIVAIEAET
jgi:hypothetical protein